MVLGTWHVHVVCLTIHMNNNYSSKLVLQITEFNGFFTISSIGFLLSFMHVYNLNIYRTTYFSAIKRVR